MYVLLSSVCLQCWLRHLRWRLSLFLSFCFTLQVCMSAIKVIHVHFLNLVRVEVQAPEREKTLAYISINSAVKQVIDARIRC
jgi:hypothetical protein